MNTASPAVYVVNFGTGKTGLSSVGFALRGVARTTGGVTELVPGAGIYGVTLDGVAAPSYILWDTGDTSPLHRIEDINIPLCNQVFQSVDLGPAHSGLSGVGVTIAGVRTTVPELASGSGIYGGLFTPPPGFGGVIFWDSGEGPSTVHAVDTLNLSYELIHFFRASSFIFRRVSPLVWKIEVRV